MAPALTAMRLIARSMLDPWENVASEMSEAVRLNEGNHLIPVCDHYNIGNAHNRRKKYCMFVGLCHAGEGAMCAHLWPKCTRGRGLETLELNAADVNNPRNFLRLHKSIEKAFDRKRIIFELAEGDPPRGQIWLRGRILDPSLRLETFTQKGCEIRFSTLDTKRMDYIFTQTRKPFLRILATHACRAIDNARNMNWIEDDPIKNEFVARSRELARLSLDGNEAVINAFF